MRCSSKAQSRPAAYAVGGVADSTTFAVSLPSHITLSSMLQPSHDHSGTPELPHIAALRHLDAATVRSTGSYRPLSSGPPEAERPAPTDTRRSLPLPWPSPVALTQTPPVTAPLARPKPCRDPLHGTLRHAWPRSRSGCDSLSVNPPITAAKDEEARKRPHQEATWRELTARQSYCGASMGGRQAAV